MLSATLRWNIILSMYVCLWKYVRVQGGVVILLVASCYRNLVSSGRVCVCVCGGGGGGGGGGAVARGRLYLYVT